MFSAGLTIGICTNARLARPLLVRTLWVWPLRAGRLWVWHLRIRHLRVGSRAKPRLGCGLAVSRLSVTSLVIGVRCPVRRHRWTLVVVGWGHTERIGFGRPVDIVVKGVVLPHYRVAWLVLRHVSFPHCKSDTDRK